MEKLAASLDNAWRCALPTLNRLPPLPLLHTRHCSSLCAGMPVRIAEVRLAEPAITPFAILAGDNHARLIPRRKSLAEYRARLTFFFAWSFSSADVMPRGSTLLALLRGHCIEGCPALLYVLAFALRASYLTLLVL